MLTPNERKDFSRQVVEWFRKNGRSFPWRSSTNPYEIFVAEILLRKTQAERVVKAYLEITTQYSSFEALSRADLSELRKLFQPLGLIKRADILVNASKYLVDNCNGKLPKELKALLSVPGMGKYSARAVACISFGLPVPMIDESTGRLMRRLLGFVSDRPAYSDSSLLKIVETFVPKESPQDFNLGLLDIASEFCRPKKPTCNVCILSKFCRYFSKATYVAIW